MADFQLPCHTQVEDRNIFGGHCVTYLLELQTIIGQVYSNLVQTFFTQPGLS